MRLSHMHRWERANVFPLRWKQKAMLLQKVMLAFQQILGSNLRNFDTKPVYLLYFEIAILFFPQEDHFSYLEAAPAGSLQHLLC